MTLNDLFSFLKAYGMEGTGLAIVLFILWSLLKTEWFSKKTAKLWDKILGKKSNTHEINVSHIVNHNMFSYIDFWIYSKVPTIRFSSEYRTVIFRKYLTILLMKYRDDMYQYISSGVYEKMDEAELWKSILSLLNNIVYDYEKEM